MWSLASGSSVPVVGIGEGADRDGRDASGTVRGPDPAFRRRFSVTHVVTAGSPIATAPVPPSVAVLSLEHDHDLVPRLAGAANPDRAGWVTVRAAAEPPGHPPDAALSHEATGYADTAAAVDASPDEGLRRWRAGLEPFVAGDGVTATEIL